MLKAKEDSKMRLEVKKFITSKTKKVIHDHPVSSVDCGMFIDSLNKEIRKKFGAQTNRKEYIYASERFWKLHKYTNVSE